jgi:hypothetical protein
MTNTLSLSAESQPLVPLAAYKCLVKMAIAIMPPRFLPMFEHTIRWLLNPDHADGAADVAASAKCNFQFQPGPMPHPQGQRAGGGFRLKSEVASGEGVGIHR